MLDMMVLARRVGAETLLQRVTAGWWNQLIEKQWTVQFWSYDPISEVSTNDVFILTSRLCHVWLCDVASPIPSWHRLRRGGVTFGRLAVIDFDGCHCLLIYCVVRFRTLVQFRRCRFQNDGGNSVRCIICCIDSGLFWTGIFEMPEVYITVDYVVDRSLERA